MYPIIVGGNGHSGTRLFADILISCDINMGMAGISHAKKSRDLNVRGLMNKWMKSYLLGLPDVESENMKRQFSRRIRMLLPFRSKPWGFKNPRSMFLLPMYYQLYPDLKYIHVIRDGRDMCFGNPFVHSPMYWSFVTEEESNTLSPEERMIKFWGASNRRVRAFGKDVLRERYLEIRFEDICDNPVQEIEKIVQLIGSSGPGVEDLALLVNKPKSIGRWEQAEADEIDRVLQIGRADLEYFGYL